MDALKVAAVQWQVTPAHSWSGFWDHCRRCLDLASGADLVVLPEHFVLETWPLLGDGGLRVLGSFRGELAAWFSQESTARGCTIVAGSWFNPGLVNQVEVFSPDGQIRIQPKNVLTQFESVEWGLVEAQGLTRQVDPRLGTLVCYDSEFPEAGRALASEGVLLLAVPAFTEGRHGFHRVRHGCLARALENQIYVVHASLVGGLGVEPCVTATGSSAILAPPVRGFPEDGVLAESPFDEECSVAVEVCFEALLAAREDDDVRNWNDRDRSQWKFQP